MTGIITQPRTLVQRVVGGGGADLPAPKFGNNFQWKIGKIRLRTEGPQDPLLHSQPACQTVPKYMSTGSDQECGSLLSPQAS